MRIIFLSIIMFVFLYQYRESNRPLPQMDAIKLKLGAPKRIPSLIKKEEKLTPSDEVEVSTVEQSPAQEEPKIHDEVSEEDHDLAMETTESEQVDEAPSEEVDHQEKSWQEELGQVISQLEPENAEEIFNSYVSERENFQSSLEDLVKNQQKNQDLEFLISELENQHEERVKDIFGRHYEEIKEHHTKFLEIESP
jgi:hypothetical protein